MARRISQSIVPTTEDVNALRDALAVRGPHDPVIAELRRTLNDLTPQWLGKLSDSDELTGDRLKELSELVQTRRAILTALPDSKTKGEALGKLDAAGAAIEEMIGELTGGNVFSLVEA